MRTLASETIHVRDRELKAKIDLEAEQSGRNSSDIVRDRLRASYGSGIDSKELKRWNEALLDLEERTKKAKLAHIEEETKLTRARRIVVETAMPTAAKERLMRESEITMTPSEMGPRLRCPEPGCKQNFDPNMTDRLVKHLEGDHEYDRPRAANKMMEVFNGL